MAVARAAVGAGGVGSEAVAATLAAAVYESRGAAEVMVHDLLRDMGRNLERAVLTRALRACCSRCCVSCCTAAAAN